MDAKELWLKRKQVMDYEDKMNEWKEDVDEFTLNILKKDDLINELIEDHNKLSEEFEKQVEELTKPLQEKLERIQKEKQEIYSYKNYILENDKELSEVIEKYLEAKKNWKKSITEYTIQLDEFVNSGETKDV